MEWYWLLFLLPSLLVNIFDSFGWRALLLSMGRKVPLTALVIVHVGSEAIARSIPLGVPLADSARSLLLKRDHAIPLTEGAFGSLLRRLSLGTTQCILLSVAIVIGYSDISKIFSGLKVEGVSTNRLILCIIATAVVTFGVIFVLRKQEVFIRRFRFIRPLRARLRSTVLALQTRTPEQRLNVFKVLSFYLALWSSEVVETYVLLNALGFNSSIENALSIEAGVSLVRLVAFFLPSGIGVQETGYAGIIGALGLTGASHIGIFLVAKRLRDVVWISLGFVILLWKGVTPSRKGISLELTKI